MLFSARQPSIGRAWLGSWWLWEARALAVPKPPACNVEVNVLWRNMGASREDGHCQGGTKIQRTGPRAPPAGPSVMPRATFPERATTRALALCLCRIKEPLHLLPFSAPRGAQGGERKGITCAAGKTGMTRLQTDIFRRWFYEPSLVSPHI